MYYAIHIAAKNDANGNPRRAVLIYDAAGNHVGTVDEGYKGVSGAIAASGLIPEGATVRVLARIPTTPMFRRDCLREARAL